jgi:topoisomerase-4 subunit A
MKRFFVSSVTRDKEYDLTAGNKGSKVLYFTANPNGEAEIVTVHLRALAKLKKLKIDIDFSELAIKGRSSKGNIVVRTAVKKIELKEKGKSTLKPRKVWFDEIVQRLNVDNRGDLLGEFTSEDRLLIINQKGEVKTIEPKLTTHFDADMIVLEKWNPNKPISVIHYEGEKERYYVKRFMIENPNKEEKIISDHPKSFLEIVSTDYRPMADIIFSKRSLDSQNLNFEEFIAIKGINAIGNQLTTDKIKQVNLLESLPYIEPKVEEIDVEDEETIQADSHDTKTDSKKNKDNDSDTKTNTSEDNEGQTSLF